MTWISEVQDFARVCTRPGILERVREAAEIHGESRRSWRCVRAFENCFLPTSFGRGSSTRRQCWKIKAGNESRVEYVSLVDSASNIQLRSAPRATWATEIHRGPWNSWQTL